MCFFKSVWLIYCSVAAVWPYWPNWTIWQAVYMSESRRSSGSQWTGFWGPKAWPSCRKPALLLPHTAALSGKGWRAKGWAWYTAHIFVLNRGQTEITVFYFNMLFKKSSKKWSEWNSWHVCFHCKEIHRHSKGERNVHSAKFSLHQMYCTHHFIVFALNQWNSLFHSPVFHMKRLLRLQSYFLFICLLWENMRYIVQPNTATCL